MNQIEILTNNYNTKSVWILSSLGFFFFKGLSCWSPIHIKQAHVLHTSAVRFCMLFLADIFIVLYCSPDFHFHEKPLLNISRQCSSSELTLYISHVVYVAQWPKLVGNNKQQQRLRRASAAINTREPGRPPCRGKRKRNYIINLLI